MFTEEKLQSAKIEGVGSIAMVKRVRTRYPFDDWHVVDQVEQCNGYRKRTTRTHGDFAAANNDYQKRLALMKMKGSRND